MTPTGLTPCSQCGYESPDNAKFCRSCGAPLFAETESSSAGTRHYGRQEGAVLQPMSAPLPSQPLPPSVVDAFGDETRRQAYVPPVVSNTNPFAAPPVPQQYGYAPPVPQYNYAPPVPGPSKRRRLLKWGFAGSALAIAMGLGAAMNEDHNNARISDAERALIEDARREGRLNDRMASGFDDARARAERARNDAIRQVEQARDAARRAAESANKTDVSGIPLLDLDKYEFDQATVSSAIRIPGKEMRQQYVNSDFGFLIKHYQQLLGKPIILQNTEDDDDKRALFQSVGTPEQASVSVLIKHSDEDKGDWEILILRSPFSFPRAGGSTITLPAAPPAPPPPPPVVDAPDGKAPVGNGPATDSAKPAVKVIR